MIVYKGTHACNLRHYMYKKYKSCVHSGYINDFVASDRKSVIFHDNRVSSCVCFRTFVKNLESTGSQNWEMSFDFGTISLKRGRRSYIFRGD